MKNIQNLEKGQTLLTSVRKVNGGKFQIEIAEIIENPNAQVNVASLLNAGDSRFSASTGKPRRAWQAGTAEGLAAVGIDVESLSFSSIDGKEIATVNMLNPEIGGTRLHVRLVDSLEADYEGQAPKQVTDKDGNITYFMKDGQHIYQSTQIVAGEAKHAVIASSERVAAKAVVKQTSAALND